MVQSEESLFTFKEVSDLMDFKKGAKNLYWNNNFKQIGKNKKYQGQWTKDRYKPTWEGLGTIEFSDGSVYKGQTKNGLFNGKG